MKILSMTERENEKRGGGGVGEEGKEEYPLHHCVTGNLIDGER